ncbi:winged helix-turn-helix domain-containing protein [Microvirga tunisiensis]|uniref:Uncharacterized protein n=1 Tax=Microvirga tunisiensis TaxID=2108360 RepID=A0A5N7N4G3_9HYPH|nr:winged helix-turn-helix domain-containing protein [Microvirga tunisiensis]MPR12489.1 hypothetical protein [Microvirga tunisiensis]MPR30396.1 hypothetical protein [Microvirga tunisiensis]
MVSSALPSKLVPPEPYGLVSRHRLFNEIRQAPPRSLIWIAAPPGAGKSSTAATWLHAGVGSAHQRHGIWYRLDEMDANPCLFFQSLKRSIARLPGAPVDALPDLTPEALPGLHEFAENWFEELLRDEGRPPYLFVFDDVHRLPSEAAPLGILPILAGQLRADDQVLCLSRQDPSESVLATLPPSRLIQILDLRVQIDEFEDFKRDLGSSEELTRSAFVARLRQSGHWIADLVVASSSRLPLRQLSALPPSAFTQFFSSYSEAERQGLLATAFLQAGHEEEWGALGGADAVAAVMRLAEERSLLTRLVNGALRKHDLFFEWLKAAAEATLAPGDLQKARLHTGRLLLGRGELLTGARLLLEASAHEEVEILVRDQAQDLIGAGQNRELLQLITMLPERTQAEPAIRISQAYARLPFEPQAARADFAGLWRSLDPAAEASLYVQAVYGEVRAALADWSLDTRLMALVAETRPALDLVREAPEPVRHQLAVGRALAMLLGEPTHPDVPSAHAELEQALPLLPPTIQLSTGSLLANYFLWWRGDLEAGRFQVDALRPLVGRADIPPLATLSWYYAAAAVAFRDGNGEALRRLADEAKAFAHQWGISHRLSTIAWVLAQAFAAEGSHADARGALHQYERIVGYSRGANIPGPHMLRAAVALSAGDHDQAIAEAHQALSIALKSGASQEIGNQTFLLGMAQAAVGDEAARVSIAELRELATRARNAVFALHADLADAFLAHTQGRMSEFVQLWARMGQAACRLRFRQITGMNRPYLGRLANDALSHGADVRITRDVIELWRLAPPDNGSVDERWPYPVEFYCLGGFAIHLRGDKIRAGQGKAQRKPLELLWLLIIADERGVSQDLLADQLWPELDGDRAMHTLRTTVYRLRKLIGAEAILQEDDHVRLNTTIVRTDFGRLRTALSRLNDPRLPQAERGVAFDQVLRLYRGPLLPGISLDSVIEERERLAGALVSKALGFLMTLDPADPITAVRVHRLRTAAPDMKLPPAIARLWSVEA